MQSNTLVLCCVVAACVVGCSKSSEGASDSAAAATASRTDTSAAASAAASGYGTDTASASANTAPGSGAVVKIASNATIGTYLSDASGRALYLFEKDERGESYCESACAKAWPPYVSRGSPASGDPAVKAPLLSTITRKDGSRQVTYDGKPLYHYAEDTGPASTKGQGVKEFGAEWYLVSPSGSKQEGKK